MKDLHTEIIMKASANLQEEIEKELENNDPSLEEADSILNNNIIKVNNEST